mmetsp:Transcript_126498/g.282802  ORF Transcript_126498/g.282802 Transcript_126498/m.282802 type:complete len:392 (-) Transcript_126498:1058-2233(-)
MRPPQACILELSLVPVRLVRKSLRCSASDTEVADLSLYLMAIEQGLQLLRVSARCHGVAEACNPQEHVVCLHAGVELLHHLPRQRHLEGVRAHLTDVRQVEVASRQLLKESCDVRDRCGEQDVVIARGQREHLQISGVQGEGHVRSALVHTAQAHRIRLDKFHVGERAAPRVDAETSKEIGQAAIVVRLPLPVHEFEANGIHASLHGFAALGQRHLQHLGTPHRRQLEAEAVGHRVGEEMIQALARVRLLKRGPVILSDERGMAHPAHAQEFHADKANEHLESRDTSRTTGLSLDLELVESLLGNGKKHRSCTIWPPTEATAQPPGEEAPLLHGGRPQGPVGCEACLFLGGGARNSINGLLGNRASVARLNRGLHGEIIGELFVQPMENLG